MKPEDTLVQPASPQVDGVGQTPTPPPPPPDAGTSHNIVSVFPVDPVTAAPVVPGASEVESPLSAGDGDVIEKAWVEKAEKVIDQHKYDPHQQEEAAERLNQEYLKQRFGLDVAKPKDKG